jgi:hypothetical protein
MQRIVCKNCGKENLISSERNSIKECAFCFEQLPVADEITNCNSTDGQPVSLILTYKKTSEKIVIPIAEKVILGRDGLGADVFNRILSEGKPVISRRHFSIEFRDDSFYIKDEGSKNGTYYGAAKLSCKVEQKLEENDILFIGEELFLAQIEYADQCKDKLQAIEPSVEETKPVVYRCNETGCGYESNDFAAVCPKCSTYNSLVPIF